MSGGNRRYDLTPGQRFTRLEVIRETEPRNGRRYALCRCDCGTEREFNVYKLLSGQTKSCGCLGRERITEAGRAKAKDITGQSFGRLTVLRKDDEKLSGGSLVWICACECGNTVSVPSRDLLSGNTKSCGCAISEFTKSLTDYNKKHHTVDGAFVPLLRQKVQPNNKTGVKGVSIRRKKDGSLQYLANISIKGKRYYLGIYSTLEEAVAARKKAEEKYHKPYIDALSLPRNVKDLRGNIFGRLKVVEYVGRSIWKCECACGNIVEVLRSSLISGATRSCGCLRREVAPTHADKTSLKKHIKDDPYRSLRRKVRADNKSGVKGVRYSKTLKKWVANITIHGKQIYLGSYVDFDQAVMARKKAEEKYHRPFIELIKEDKNEHD